MKYPEYVEENEKIKKLRDQLLGHGGLQFKKIV